MCSANTDVRFGPEADIDQLPAFSLCSRSRPNMMDQVPNTTATRSVMYETLTRYIPVCTENINPGVMVMKSAKDGVRFDASGPLNHARERCIFVE